jgi:hypothetical protein
VTVVKANTIPDQLLREIDYNPVTGEGVYWNKRLSKWHAQIQHEKKTTYLGLFTDEYVAHLAYVNAAKRMHGEFARAA